MPSNVLLTLATVVLTPVLVALFVNRAGNPMGHAGPFMRRRILNWVPLGITYAFLYMGRYNLTVAKNAFGDLMPKSEYGVIFSAGTLVYAFAFIVNGPLTDKIGGRKAILLAAAGAAVANAAMGWFTYSRTVDNLVPVFSILYAINMYFQSFGAVAIVKVNSAWFHVRERGVFGGLFGILISAGIFLAYQVGQHIVDYLHTSPTANGTTVTSPPYWVFWVPSLLLGVFFVLDWFIVRDRPGETGHADFELGDASSGEDDRPDPVGTILRKVVTHPIVLTIAAIEFCTGVVRQGVMQWYIIYAKEKGFMHSFWVPNNWGLMLFIAGAAGGMVAGWLSDKVFGSRRGPVAALLYGMMVLATLVMIPSLNGLWVMGIAVILISFAVIGTHGMLSGTATMDFGGRKNAGTAVGLIDGAVYLGTGLQAISLGYLTEKSWSYWPVFLLPFSILGFVLSMRIRKAMPKGKRAAH